MPVMGAKNVSFLFIRQTSSRICPFDVLVGEVDFGGIGVVYIAWKKVG